MEYIDLIGFFGGAVILISVMMTSFVRKKIIGVSGSMLFLLYGVLAHLWPVALLGGALALVYLYQLYEVYFNSNDFRLLKTDDRGEYLNVFFDFYENDIRRYFPDFDFDVDYRRRVWLVLRNMVVVGIVIGSEEDNSFLVEMDYAIPQYRDFKIGRFLFRKNSEFFANEPEYKQFIARTGNEQHKKYLLRMGFHPVEDKGAVVYVKPL